jgi:putative sigma-54 modulation protein
MSNHDLILSGIHLELTAALKETVRAKMERLFKHETRIVRLRIELEHTASKDHLGEFVAKGHLILSGPELTVAVASEDLYKSIDLLVDKLDRKLRRRSRLLKVKRHHPHEIEIPACLPKVSLA